MKQAALKQPSALKIFFLTETWERFAYFGVQAILVLFMTTQLGFSDENAYLLYASLGALLFISPVICGFLTDRYLGNTQAIIMGAIFLMCGYFLMGTGKNNLLYLAFSSLIVGNGFFKPNISAMLGTCYKDQDPRRENGFTIFYVGINLGGLTGIISCSFIAKHFNWLTAFSAAGLALIAGMIVFLFGYKIIKKDAVYEHIPKAKYAPFYRLKIAGIYFSSLLMLAPLYVLLSYPASVQLVVDIFSAALLITLSIIAFLSPAQERRNLIVCVILIIFSIAFWALYMQAPMSLTLFINRVVDRHVFGFLIPTAAMWSLNGIFTIVFAPIIIKLWAMLNKRRREPNTATKFAVGILLMGLGYMVLTLAAQKASHGEKITLWWIIASYGIQTLGELCLSPIGLAMVTQLAPVKLRSLMMGTWFFAVSAATAIAGVLATIASIDKNQKAIAYSARVYAHAFGLYGYMAIGISILLFIISPWLMRLLSKKIKEAPVSVKSQNL